MTADLERQTRFRQFSGVPSIISKVLLAAIPTCGIIYVSKVPDRFGLVPFREQYLSVFLTLVLISAFLNIPATQKSPRDKLPWYDILLVFMSAAGGGYLIIFYPELMPRLGHILLSNVIFGGITVLLVLEACRRLLGYLVAGMGLFFVLYGHLSYLLPGVIGAREIAWERLFTFLYLDPGALLGLPLYIVSTIIFAYIFFGQCLFTVGGGQFITNIALGLMGKYRGGPAKVAVVASGLFGTISGSPSANVAVDGWITIPLMKKIGYSSEFASAVEATASTGGAIMPPVMASVAFIIAEFLEISYAKVCIAAAIPAILYYVALYAQLHLRALKDDIKGLPPEDLPSVKGAIKQGWAFILPLAALVYFLFVLYLTPELCAIYASALALLISLFMKEGRINFRRLLSILTETGQAVLEIAAICAMAGFIIGSLAITGLGISLSNAILIISGGNVALILIMAAIASSILGMGMPLIGTYLMLAILIAPALVKSGVLPLAAHLFLMYFGVMSFLTPPVCIAAYVAAGIGNCSPMKTGFQAVRLGIVAYIVPFVFAYSPALLLMGSGKDIVSVVFTALLGIISLAIGLEGYLFDRISILKRVGFALSGLMLIVPILTVSLIGLSLAILLVLWEYLKKRKTGIIASSH